jgi:hypothetical protein
VLDPSGNFVQINIEITDNAKANRKPEDNLTVDRFVGLITILRLKIPKVIIDELPFDPSNYMERMI